jgi:hypothetical protein
MQIEGMAVRNADEIPDQDLARVMAFKQRFDDNPPDPESVGGSESKDQPKIPTDFDRMTQNEIRIGRFRFGPPCLAALRLLKRVDDASDDLVSIANMIILFRHGKDEAFIRAVQADGFESHAQAEIDELMFNLDTNDLTPITRDIQAFFESVVSGGGTDSGNAGLAMQSSSPSSSESTAGA